MIRRINHVGVVVDDLEKILKLYDTVFNLKPRARADAQGGKVRAAFVPVGGDEIEFLQPMDLTLPIGEYLTKHGCGIHHISLGTDDIDSDVERMRKNGVVFDREKPTVGAHGTRIIFTDPRSTGGIPIELIEEAAE